MFRIGEKVRVRNASSFKGIFVGDIATITDIDEKGRYHIEVKRGVFTDRGWTSYPTVKFEKIEEV